MKRLLLGTGGLAQRSAEGHFRIIREDQDLARSAFLLAHYGRLSPTAVQDLLTKLWDLHATALYVQIQGSSSRAELVLSRHLGHRIIARGQRLRIETETYEPAPDGSYLVERQYRQLGFYESPPAERAVVALRITPGSGHAYLVDIPHYVSHATVVIANRIVADCAAIPARGDLRYSFGGD